MPTEYFYECKQNYLDVAEKISSYLESTNLDYQNTFGIDVARIERNFFNQFSALNELLIKFDSNAQEVFRFFPNVCYGWHHDHGKRNCSLNLLLSGNKSHTYFGTLMQPQEGVGRRDFVDVLEVPYDPGKIILMNVSKRHTIYNLDNMRYLLSISLPITCDFQMVKEYLIENNF